MEGRDERRIVVKNKKKTLKERIGELREKHCCNKNYTCNQLQELYSRTDLLGLCRGWFSLDQTSLSSFSCHLDPLYLLSDSLKSSFPTHFLQIHCIGLFGPKFIHLLGLRTKLCPYIKKLKVTTILVSIGDGKFWTPILKKLSLIINCNVHFKL